MSFQTLENVRYKIHSIQVLKNLPDSEKAMNIMKWIQAMSKEILNEYHWTVGLLKEFIPNDSSLLGLNENSGEIISIRMRNVNDQTQFYRDWDIMGTFLHELVHNKIAPHNEEFNKLLIELKRKFLKIVHKTPKSFQSIGNRLGGRSRIPLTPYERLQMTLLNNKKHNIHGTQGGTRLGSQLESKKSRLLSLSLPSLSNKYLPSPSPSSSPSSSLLSASKNEHLNEKNHIQLKTMNIKDRDTTNKSNENEFYISSTIHNNNDPIENYDSFIHDSISTSSTDILSYSLFDIWTCSKCTYINKHFKNSCEMCYSTRQSKKQENDTVNIHLNNGSSSDFHQFKTDTNWICQKCQHILPNTILSCPICHAKKMTSDAVINLISDSDEE
ncbi:hypothetical protein WA158_000056 [Blastocystis sp. Blastoise]